MFFSEIGIGQSNKEWSINPTDWIDFYKKLENEKGKWKTQIWYQPTYALKEDMPKFKAQGYYGCIGRTLDRISIFPDGRAYVCSYLFDTSLHFAEMRNGEIKINQGDNEFELFTKTLYKTGCGTCANQNDCMGGCPAEEVVTKTYTCKEFDNIVPVCRLWKSDN